MAILWFTTLFPSTTKHRTQISTPLTSNDNMNSWFFPFGSSSRDECPQTMSLRNGDLDAAVIVIAFQNSPVDTHRPVETLTPCLLIYCEGSKPLM